MSNDSASKRLLSALEEQNRASRTLARGIPVGLRERLAAITTFEAPPAMRELMRQTDEESRGMSLLLRERVMEGANMAAGFKAMLQEMRLHDLVSGAPTALSESRTRIQDTTQQNPTGQVRTAADIGALVRTARKAMKMNQAEFAAHAGVGRRFVSELESGKASLEFDRVMACTAAAGVELMARVRGG